MSWFKVDDKLHDHRKIAIAGADAMGTWVLAGSWCSDNPETDGFIPTRVLMRYTRAYRSRAAKLVEATLWEVANFKGEQGFRFTNWAEYQFTAADKEKDRDSARERMRNLRAERKASSENVRPNISDVRKSSPDVLDPVPVPLPVPEPKKEKLPSVAARDRFDDFWSVYPRREDPGRAKAAWARAAKKADPDLIIDGARRYAADPNREQQFTKHPTTWLNAESWSNGPLPDRAPPERAGSAGNPMSTGTQRAMGAVEAARRVNEMRNHHLQIGAS